jgi:Fur family peroxide stress response transcriptional regulator
MKKSGSQLQEKLNKFEHICRDNGIKLTHQRMEIFHEIASSNDHPPAEKIYNNLKSKLPMISLDTVYRTLTTFEKSGIISKVSVSDSKGRYDSNLVPHHHLVCTRCKSIVDFYWPTFETIGVPSETKKWGNIHAKQVEVRGTCGNCLKRDKQST